MLFNVQCDRAFTMTNGSFVLDFLNAEFSKTANNAYILLNSGRLSTESI